MARFIRTPLLATAMLFFALPLLTVNAEAASTFMKDCSAKYKAAKADGSIDATTKWTDYMKTACKDLQTDAATPEEAPADAEPVAKVTKTKAKKKAAEVPAETAVAIPTESFMKECSAAWKSMKAAGTVPEGLTWKAFVTGKCVAAPSAAPVEEAAKPDATFMEKCATDWKAMKAAYTVPEGLTWKAFVKGKCVDKPTVTKVAAKKKIEEKVADAKKTETTKTKKEAGTETFIQKCGTDWKAMKAAGTVPEGLTWKAFVTGKCVAKPAASEKTVATDDKPFMTKCADDWKAMKKAKTVPTGMTWKQFVTDKCVIATTQEPLATAEKKSKKKAAAAKEVAPSEPTAEEETKPVKLVDKNGKAFTPGQLAAHARARTCGAKYRAEKAAGTLEEGQKWPQYWSACNTELKAASL